MKRILTILLALMLALFLAACGASAGQETGTPSTLPETDAPIATPEPSQEPAQTAPAESETPVPEESEAPEGGKTLVAYFSWSGNTEALAGMIQAETDADLFEILPETPYTDDYDALLDIAQEEQRNSARPAVADTVENWADYDTIFVGYPNWWGSAPMIILSFLESYDCTGKTIIPFATSGGGGLGRGVSSITDSAAGATVLEGFHVSGSRVDGAADDVAAWIDGLGL